LLETGLRFLRLRIERMSMKQILRASNTRLLLAAALSGVAIPVLIIFQIPHVRIWAANTDWDQGIAGRAPIICYPHARDVVLGMSQAQVRKLLGNPTAVERGSGSRRLSDEIWTYHYFGWNDTMTIVFGRSGTVRRRDWGHG
jgi:hypothetical protein